MYIYVYLTLNTIFNTRVVFRRDRKMLWKTEVVSVGSLPRQVLKEYTLVCPRRLLKLVNFGTPMVFIHGGAWRDPNNTYEDFDSLVKQMDRKLNEGSPYLPGDEITEEWKCYSLDYSLSPESKHPTHLVEVLNALEYIHKSHSRMILVGHSVGATLMTQIMAYREILHSREYSIPQISSVVFLDGIYDLKDLLDEYPDYTFFVKDAFKDQEEWEEKSNYVISGGRTIDGLYESYSSLDHLVVVQSTRDELLSSRQSEVFQRWLVSDLGISKDKIEYHLDDYGIHNDVYEHERISDLLIDLISQ